MSSGYHLIRNGTLINEGESFRGSLLMSGDKIAKIFVEGEELPGAEKITDAEGCLIIPGVIDDQVHFREPGNTHKGDIASESAAAVLGGITSYMDMPNNNPPAVTIEQIKAKEKIAAECSYANYSFYLGATNDNVEEILCANPESVCGVKVFMGSSTGNMLVDNQESLERIFRESPLLIATHCEYEPVIRENLESAIEKYGKYEIPFEEHCNIRSRSACIKSTEIALELALKYNSRLHILHISTKEEIDLIREAIKINPNISGEICVHYLLLDNSMYKTMGSMMKCNPSIKELSDKEALIKAVKEGVIRVIATDHAPHTKEEKSKSYIESPSGLPLVQHSLQLMIELYKDGVFSMEEVVDRMCHAPAENFKIKSRGYLREGYFADIAIINLNQTDSLSTVNPAYKCGWTPFQGKTFRSSVVHTFINGIHIVEKGKLNNIIAGKKLSFNYAVQQ